MSNARPIATAVFLTAGEQKATGQAWLNAQQRHQLVKLRPCFWPCRNADSRARAVVRE